MGQAEARSLELALSLPRGRQRRELSSVEEASLYFGPNIREVGSLVTDQEHRARIEAEPTIPS